MFLLLMLSLQIVFAQTNGTVKGTVKDANGTLLSGASITIEGERGGTLTDANGNYSLKVKPGSYTLIVSFVGQAPQRFQVTVTAGQTVEQDVTLTEVSDLSGVVVVGSRSRVPRSKLTTPVPVDVINAREIKNFAQTDITQLLTYVAPSFQSARQTISDGTDHIDPAGLRGLGPDQTLVLVNGKRRHTTALVNINGTVGRGSVGTDLNAIPVAAIERIEVLRDGAAAQYGSDAIAGVINIVLKKNYNGLSVSGMAGQNFTNMPYNGGTEIRDGLNRQIDFSWGRSAKNGSFFTLSGQWLKRDGTNRSGNDNIPFVYVGNAGGFPATPSGVNASDYRKWLINYDDSIARSRNYDRHNIVAGNSASENWGAFFNAGVNVTEKAQLYFSGGGSHRQGKASGFSRNPNSASQQPVLRNGQRYYYDGFLPEIHPTIYDLSLIAGLRTTIGNWDFDISNTAGTNNLSYSIENTGNASAAPSDTVQTSFYAGKLRFFQNTINIDLSRKYNLDAGKTFNLAFGAEHRFEKYQITSGEKSSYDSLAGRIATIDPIPPYPGTATFVTVGSTKAVPGAQVFPGFKPENEVNARRNIYAVYIDGEFNLGKLVVGVAGRFERYSEMKSAKDASTSGFGGKLTGRYEVSKNLAIRASVSNGFRAASLHQRYFNNTSTQFVGGLPSQSLTISNENAITKNAFGIQNLEPEKSVHGTIGLVGNIGSLFTFTADAYLVNIYDRIVLSTPFRRGNPRVDVILNDPQYKIDPSISAVQFWTNAVDTRTMGIDIVLTQRFRLGNGNASVSAAGNFNKNEVKGINTNSVIDKAENNPGETDKTKNPGLDFKTILFDRQQRSRIETAQPRSKINFTFTYDLRKFNMMLRTVRFGEVQYVHNDDPFAQKPDGSYWNDVGFETDQTFDARWSTDVVVTWKAQPGLSLSVGGNNIFDVYPERIFIDPRNEPQTVYSNPVQNATLKSTGGYGAGRDASNRGRFLFNANQFGFNGRFLFARLSIDVFEFGKVLKKFAPDKK